MSASPFRPLDSAAPQPPARATPGSVGYDLRSAEAFTIPGGQWRKVRTGYAVDWEQVTVSAGERLGLPAVWCGDHALLVELQIRPRSGLAVANGITVLNAPGTVDPDYTGEVCVVLMNHGRSAFHVGVGDRIAQGVFTVAWLASDAPLDDGERGDNGCGSTGVE